MARFGNSWKEVKQHIGTRTPAQIRSHAQKYYKHLRQQKVKEMKSDPGKRDAMFVITREYINRTATTCRGTQFLDSPLNFKYESRSEPSVPDQPQIKVKVEEPAKLRGGLIVPLPCYPIYVQPMPRDFKWVSTAPGKIAPPLYCNQTKRCVFPNARLTAQGKSHTLECI